MEALEYGTQEILYNLEFIERKSLRIEVNPDLSVFVSAPEKTSKKELEEKLQKKARWIIKQQRYFEQFMPRTPKREYVAGETHLYLGRRFLLRTKISDKNDVKLYGNRLMVFQKDNINNLRTKQLLISWYYSHAKVKFNKLIEESILSFSKFNIDKPKFQIRRMKNRWGSCTPKGTIILNPELIKAPTNCIRYVIIHELCHLVHPNHSKEFYKLLDLKFPDWKKWKDKLELISV